mmetsp:Transcript_5430/g.18888  ORF Transcript_5430/g.18888 Transcript_5430/m.18888 type:complete len:237 (+) Transcript_5430:4-714(+)
MGRHTDCRAHPGCSCPCAFPSRLDGDPGPHHGRRPPRGGPHHHPLRIPGGFHHCCTGPPSPHRPGGGLRLRQVHLHAPHDDPDGRQRVPPGGRQPGLQHPHLRHHHCHLPGRLPLRRPPVAQGQQRHRARAGGPGLRQHVRPDEGPDGGQGHPEADLQPRDRPPRPSGGDHLPQDPHHGGPAPLLRRARARHVRLQDLPRHLRRRQVRVEDPARHGRARPLPRVDQGVHRGAQARL